MGSVGLTGLYSEATFFKGTLDMIGVAPEFDHRGSYKTATNILTETKMTPPQREEVEDLLASVAGQIVGGIAQGRKLSPEAVRAAIDRGRCSPTRHCRRSSSTGSAIATRLSPRPTSAPDRAPS